MSLLINKNANLFRLTDDPPLSIKDLPPPNTKRWVVSRKAQLLAGIRAGLLTVEEACERYMLSAEELMSWERLVHRHGVRGLRVTKIQKYRKMLNEADG